MLIRLLGEESEALTCTAYQPFTDVPDWALPYAAYAYSKGYTNGRRPNDIRHDDECIGGDVHRISAARTALQLHRAV